jgi:hypothetical protein
MVGCSTNPVPFYLSIRKHTATPLERSLKLKKKSPSPESASELYRLSDRRLSKKLVPTFADIGCHVASVTDPYGRILAFLDRSRYYFFQVAPQLTHEAEWTPFQTHYLSKNLEEQGIESGPLDL